MITRTLYAATAACFLLLLGAGVSAAPEAPAPTALGAVPVDAEPALCAAAVPQAQTGVECTASADRGEARPCICSEVTDCVRHTDCCIPGAICTSSGICLCPN